MLLALPLPSLWMWYYLVPSFLSLDRHLVAFLEILSRLNLNVTCTAVSFLLTL